LIGLIGGTGFENVAHTMKALHQVDQIERQTCFGAHSTSFIKYKTETDEEFLFLSRFGREHELSPSAVPYRANILALKMEGVTTVVSISAAGSLKNQYPPGTLAIPEQLIDRTTRPSSFFYRGDAVAHVDMLHPFCNEGAKKIIPGGGETYLCMEGPALATMAESMENRRVASFVGMTVGTEARLCREAQICYIPLLVVTDYDYAEWKGSRGSAADIAAEASKNNGLAMALFVESLGVLIQHDDNHCSCRSALKNAVLSAHLVDRIVDPADTLSYRAFQVLTK
jgi:5'-methylthioadenosine phosphorylase